jgi:hypothetical protein
MPPKHVPTLTANLQSTKPPWTSLLVVTGGQRAESLVRPPTEFALRIIQGAKCRTTDSLLTECARALDFPDYFGHNWDALEECLIDLEWLSAKGYVLLITDAGGCYPMTKKSMKPFLRSCVMRERPGSRTGGNGCATSNLLPRPVRCIGAEKAKRAHWGMNEIHAEPTRESGIPRRTSLKRT